MRHLLELHQQAPSFPDAADPRAVLLPMLDGLSRALGFQRALVALHEPKRDLLRGSVGLNVPDSLAEMPAVRAAAENGAVFEAEEVLSIAAQAYAEATGSAMPATESPATRPDTAQLWDFDDEEEMRRRLPRLSALFLEPPA